MKAIDTHTRLYIKKVFSERNIIFELKILLQLLRFENEFFLEKISKNRQQQNATDDIPDEMRQGVILDFKC